MRWPPSGPRLGGDLVDPPGHRREHSALWTSQQPAQPSRADSRRPQRRVVRSGTLPTLISQVDRALSKPYFQAKLGEIRSRQALGRIEDAAMMLADPLTIEPILRDPTDDFLVALARTAEVQAIVTGDRDLLGEIAADVGDECGPARAGDAPG